MRYENEEHLTSLRDVFGSTYGFGANDGIPRIMKQNVSRPNTTLNIIRGDHGLSVIPFKVRPAHPRIDFVINENTNRFTIRIRYETHKIPASGITRNMECYEPLKKLLIDSSSQMDYEIIDDGEHDFLLIDVQFAWENMLHAISEVDLRKSQTKAVKSNDNVVHVFKNLIEINTLIKQCLTN